MTFDIPIILVSFILTLGLTIWVRKALVKRALLDHPNARSSHKEPVPRGGGWALLLVLIPGLLLASYAEDHVVKHAGLIAGTLALALISWRDDQKGASVRARLSIHIFAACVGSLAFSPEQLIFGGTLPFWADRIILIGGWAWFMNLYNFMDGIDGLTCAETLALATGSCLLMTASGEHAPFVSTLTLLLTGTCLGFLALNWHPAKIFLGDVGSVPLGYLTGFALISLAVNGQLIPALILPLYYLADSGITITKRALRHEKIWEAHRQHFYQRAALGKGRHDQVVLWITFANISLFGAALLAESKPFLGLGAALLIIAILLVKLHKASDTTG